MDNWLIELTHENALAHLHIFFSSCNALVVKLTHSSIHDDYVYSITQNCQAMAKVTLTDSNTCYQFIL